ncbi:MAG TPA: shikimate dehydrogenase [Candidatus Eisenbacteria bacterium]|nr:shikimate dehydrogenase [Candidatus Eisenbacteria bacterium]
MKGEPALRLFAVLGHPIAHSLSPRLHQAALDSLGVAAAYLAIDVEPSRLPDTLRSLHEMEAHGLSVTAPLKRVAYESAVRVTDEARVSGVANCLRREAAGYVATNTDGEGFVGFARDVGVRLEGARVVLLGGGGSAAGLYPALARAGAACLVVARDRERAQALPGLAAAPWAMWDSPEARKGIGEAHLVINATTLGGAPADPLPCDPAWLAPGAVAVDLRYAPRRTPWLVLASARGVRAFDGLGLLVHQGALSLRFWLDVEPRLDRLREFVGWKPLPLGVDGSVEE